MMTATTMRVGADNAPPVFKSPACALPAPTASPRWATVRTGTGETGRGAERGKGGTLIDGYHKAERGADYRRA